MSQTLVLASANEGKIRELRRVLAREAVSMVSAAQLGSYTGAQEIGHTFLSNAYLKARAVSVATGLAALGDDSGLCVKALGGHPGVHSARYGGEEITPAERNSLLLRRLTGVAWSDRQARFECVLVLHLPDEQWVGVRGECQGRICMRPRGGSGFGYDPLFELADGRTMAELTEAEKDLISHRGRALAELRPWLSKLLG
ncbi:MAG: RdgB/HAM1 family non-canonical purine NTP pyrophosphatase [Candidatus Schekmanbacteria bacterium]|nr:RdgB/HAM1 family non-canonical purine NTP pyrophosphatase [Candidatus Schekmanbacteria bacterium]